MSTARVDHMETARMAIKEPSLQRAFDFALATPLALLIVPVTGLLVIAIWMETAGNPLFIQSRVGRDQRLFRIYKLRTMRIGTPDRASHEVGHATITRLGSLLRRLKLDELPQIFNVLAGDMSFIGPRPCLPSQVDLIDERARRGLYAIRPGITGPAQLEGIDMSQPKRLAAREEVYFAGKRSLFDWQLLWATVTGGGRGDAAERPQG